MDPFPRRNGGFVRGNRRVVPASVGHTRTTTVSTVDPLFGLGRREGPTSGRTGSVYTEVTACEVGEGGGERLSRPRTIN